LLITSNIPFSARQEQSFLRLMGRYFRSCEYLMSGIDLNLQRKKTWLERWKKAFYTHELSNLPMKLAGWAKFIDSQALAGTSPQEVQAVLNSLQTLSFRMNELIAERGSPQAPFLVQELRSDVQAWRVKVLQTFQRLVKDPGAGERETLHAGLAQIVDHLEQRIEQTYDKAEEKQLSHRDGENFYRLLGAYRGVSKALIEYAGSAGDINWARWREERF
jgi:hypothetical protein